MHTIKSSIASALAMAVLLSSVSFNAAEDRRRRRHRSRASAAAFATILGVFGTIAAQTARDRYRGRYY